MSSDYDSDSQDSRGGDDSSDGEDRRPASFAKGRRVYVGNLSFEASWQDLKDFARDHVGGVLFSTVLQDWNGRSKGCGIVEFESSDLARKAIVEMNEKEFYGRRIFVREDREEGKVQYRGRPSQYRRGRGRARGRGRGRSPRGIPRGRPRRREDEGGPPRRRRRDLSDGSGGEDEEEEDRSSGFAIFVGNLPFSTELSSLRTELEKYGNVVSCEIPIGFRDRPRGYGLAEYETTEEATSAIESLNGTEFEGRSLTVRLDRRK